MLNKHCKLQKTFLYLVTINKLTIKKGKLWQLI